jgi:hypothetical protein
MNLEDALNFTISYLRNPPRSGYSSYGYDFYVPHVILAYLNTHENKYYDPNHHHVSELSPEFYAAAWELCRRGIMVVIQK